MVRLPPNFRAIASAAKHPGPEGVRSQDRHDALRRLAATRVGFMPRGSAMAVEDYPNSLEMDFWCVVSQPQLTLQ